MKQYFNFTLTGKKLFPLWIGFLILYLIPYILIFTNKDFCYYHSGLFILLILLLMFVVFTFTFYLSKMMINNITYKDKSLVFNGTLGRFLLKILIGYILTMLTLGVYLVWFIKDISCFFIENTNYESEPFTFKGKIGKLAAIFWLTYFLPFIITEILLLKFILNNPNDMINMLIIMGIMIIVMIPFMYLFYKWIFDIDYKESHISWNTKFCASTGKIFFEIVLTLCTAGLYFPMAWLRLYYYFAEKTHIQNGEITRKAGFEKEKIWNDFFYIWGQLLLTSITLGIYYPWAFAKVGKRILSKTYIAN